MSAPDTLHFKMPLPADAPDYLRKCPVFQVSGLGNSMGEYVIDEDGKLYLEGCISMALMSKALGCDPATIPMVPIEYKRKKLELFATNLRASGPRGGKYAYFTDDGSDLVEMTYIVQIRNGKVSSVTEKYRRTKPARHISEFDGSR